MAASFAPPPPYVPPPALPFGLSVDGPAPATPPPSTPMPFSPPAAPAGCKEGDSGLWWIGLFIFIVGTSAQALGMNMQRLAAARAAAAQPDPALRPKLRKSKLWVTGFALMAGAGLFCSLGKSYTFFRPRLGAHFAHVSRPFPPFQFDRAGLIFASQSLIAPLILLIFVANPIFAHTLNGEAFEWRTDGVLTMLIMAGVLGCVLVAPQEHCKLSHSEYISLLEEPTFIGNLTSSHTLPASIHLPAPHFWKSRRS